MNRENLKYLSNHKRDVIERAHVSTCNRDISIEDFFIICRQILTDDEYDSLFDRQINMIQSQEQQAEDINIKI